MNRLILLFATLIMLSLAWPSSVMAGDEPADARVADLNLAAAADTNLLATSLTPRRAESTLLRVTVSVVTTNSVFNARYTDGTDSFTVALNDGTTLTAGRLYTLWVPCSQGISVNFRCTTATTVGVFFVEEYVRRSQ